jgi:hypothetical protein
MQPIIPDRPSGTPPLPASAPRERRAPSGGRLARLAALDPGQPRQALIFLSGYRPRVFDVILDAVEPPDLSRTRRPSSRMPVGRGPLSVSAVASSRRRIAGGIGGL